MPAIVNSANIQPKKDISPGNIKFWHLYIGHLSYKNLISLKNIKNKIDLKKTALHELCENCQKKIKLLSY